MQNQETPVLKKSNTNVENLKQESNFKIKSDKNNDFIIAIKNMQSYLLLNGIKKEDNFNNKEYQKNIHLMN